jgi:hypothetical protein
MSKLLYDGRFTANQVALAPTPRDSRAEIFFSTEPLRSLSLCNILSEVRMGLSLINMLGLSSSVCTAHIACYLKVFLMQYTQVLCQWYGHSDHANIIRIYPIVYHRLIGSYMNDKLEMIWKETGLGLLVYYSDIHLEELRNTAKNL